MQGKKFVNIALTILVVILAGTTGYFALANNKKTNSINQQNYLNSEVLPADANNEVAQDPSVSTTDSQKQESLESCFYGGALAADLDKSNWKTFEGFGFSVKYPSESISIKSDGDQASEVGFEISSLTSPHKSDVGVYRLKRLSYRAGFLHSPPILYEPYSNTWWIDEYVWDSSKLEQCNPNPRGKTDDGKYSIYSTGGGDVGISFTNYFIVLRDIVKSDTGNYEPIVVEFEVRSDGNDPSYSTYQEFQDVLENIIKTLELRPTSRG